ncbi:MAG: ABC transporter permease [Lachnospiraceae bacterium]|nr:ABC transporter permease [Lachnospiraceae bacterium]
MYKLFFIAWNNIKKQKGDMITFLLFTMLASYLVFQCSSALLGMGKVMDSRFKEVNGAEIMVLGGEYEEEVTAWTQAFSEAKDITDLEQTPFLRMYCSFRNAKETDFEEFQFLIEPYTVNPKYSNLGINPEGLSEKDILIPMFLKSRLAVGDTMELKFNDDVYSFRVAGYTEDPYFSSSINITVYYCYMSQTMMDMLAEKHPSLAGFGVVFRGKVDEKELDNGLLTSDVEKQVTTAYHRLIAASEAEHPERDYNNFMAVNWQMMRGGAQFLPQVVMAVVLLFAVIILVVAFVIIAYGVRDFILRNMKNTGILEASGYTTGTLRATLCIQITAVAYVGSKIGIFAGLLTQKPFGNLVSGILGISWNQPVNLGAALCTLYGLTLVTLLIAWLLGGRYKKITVLDALRGGINTHNYKKNYVPLDKSVLPLPVAMSLKSTLGGKRRSILLVLISAVLAIAMTCGFALYETFGTNDKAMGEMFGFEIGTVQVTKSNPAYDEEIRSMKGVSNVLTYTTFEPIIKKGDKEWSTYTFAESDVNERLNLMVLKGRVPVHDNEIMLTQVLAEDLSVNVGDVVTVSFGQKTEEFIVTGFDQRMEHMGRTANVTFDGAKKLLGSIEQVTYIVTGKDGVTYDELASEVKAVYAAHDDSSYVLIDSEKNMKVTTGTVSKAMKAVCVVIAVITTFIVIFTEALIIRGKITREWRDMGISKALGMTSGQQVVQIMLSNLPAVLLGSVLGVFLAGPSGKALCRVIFSLFGMKKVNFDASLFFKGVSALGIVLMAAATAAVMGLRVRRCKPVEMITEE